MSRKGPGAVPKLTPSRNSSWTENGTCDMTQQQKRRYCTAYLYVLSTTLYSMSESKRFQDHSSCFFPSPRPFPSSLRSDCGLQGLRIGPLRPWFLGERCALGQPAWAASGRPVVLIPKIDTSDPRTSAFRRSCHFSQCPRSSVYHLATVSTFHIQVPAASWLNLFGR